jgi:pyruvate/2-oxoglutarate dehydrogenase complex dihydrolipoamide acyltransferase (E2) component
MGRIREFRFPRERRHTYYFLRHAREFSPVYLDTSVNMSAVQQVREKAKHSQKRSLSYVSFLIQTVSHVLTRYPEANSGVRHGWFPKMALYDHITAKFTLDKTIQGRRAVVTGVIPDSDRCSLWEIQEHLERYRDQPFEAIEEFAPLRKLQSLPLPLGQWMYNRALSNLKKREQLQGTFCVTSLGHRPVQSFHPVISATLCFGMGRVQDQPVVLDGEIRIQPMMGLSLAFDHRAIDGAMAADILAEVKQGLEAVSSKRMEG